MCLNHTLCYLHAAQLFYIMKHACAACSSSLAREGKPYARSRDRKQVE